MTYKGYLYIIAAICVSIIAFAVLMPFFSKSPLDVNVKNIEADITIERFDKAFCYGYTPAEIIANGQKFGDFFDIYSNNIIGCGNYNDRAFYECIKVFFADYSVSEAYTAVEKEFEDIEDISTMMEDAFKHYKYYFPEENLPRLITFIAGFNQSVVIGEDFIGIGLDKYLGSNCELYNMMQIPEYAKSDMERSRIPYNVLTAMLEDRYPYNCETDNLINRMIYNGIILYGVNALLPKSKDKAFMNYSDEEMKYCKNYERDIWTTLIEEKLLFSTDGFTIKKFVDNAPFTAQFGPDSPARVANWIGLQIVRAYAKNNNISVNEILTEKDYQKVLNISGYDPKYR